MQYGGYMKNTTSNIDLTIEGMRRGIEKAGGLFYQYRPCRRNDATIYDIENIRHEVVYAQTPLNMNDPFDSQIGFSTSNFIDECVNEVLNALGVNEPLKYILNNFIKARITGRTVSLIKQLNDLRSFIWNKQRSMHMTHLKMIDFVHANLNLLIDKCPADLKNHFPKNTFSIFCRLVCSMNKSTITEEDVKQAFELDSTIEEVCKKISDIRDSVYLIKIREFLEKITVSCFSSSGWDNQLMWSHYANSYAGICIEYDFSNIEDNIGFFYPVKYNSHRPTLTLEDIGLKIQNQDGKIIAANDGEFKIENIFSYMLVKNTVWEYEKEWRIVNIGEANTPRFIHLPHIKSITFGLRVDEICKSIIWEICKEKGIACYQLMVNSDNYELKRKLLSEEDFVFDIDQETTYVTTLMKQINIYAEKLSIFAAGITEDGSGEGFENLDIMLADTIDVISNVYFIKQSLNRIACSFEEDAAGESIPEDLMNYMHEMERVVDITKKAIPSIRDTLPTLILAGIVPIKKRNNIIQQLNNILELTAKYQEIIWHDSFHQKI